MRKAIPAISLSLCLAFAGSCAQRARAAETREHYLDIPGIGRVPIPLPPGTSVFGPSHKAPPAEPPATAERAPGANQPGANGLDALLSRLSQARSEEDAEALAQAIARIWVRSGSATADLLTQRAAVAAVAGQVPLALDILDHVVRLEPAWAQGFVARAHLRLLRGDSDGAERDLEAAIRLDPRRFDALGALGELRERAGEPARALDAYRRALALYPRHDEWRRAEERLDLEVRGRDI